MADSQEPPQVRPAANSGVLRCLECGAEDEIGTGWKAEIVDADDRAGDAENAPAHGTGGKS